MSVMSVTTPRVTIGGKERDHGREEDELMEDVGRPPDKLQGSTLSWAEKVKSGSVGIFPVPEDVVGEDFVRERVMIEFPNGEDGEPVMTVEKEVLDAMNGFWRNCLYVKVLGWSMNLPFLVRRLKKLWRPKEGLWVIDLPRHFFLIRFELEEDYLVAVTGGPWRVFGSCLLMKAWSVDFDPLVDEITTTSVWTLISNLPVNFYHHTILMELAKGLGTPVKVDLTTLHLERTRFARICVEVNLHKQLKGTILINGERYFIAYEGLTNICWGCGFYGHLVNSCPKKKEGDVSVAKVQSATVKESAARVTEDGFTIVTKTGRGKDKGEMTLNQTASSSATLKVVNKGTDSNSFTPLVAETGNEVDAGVSRSPTNVKVLAAKSATVQAASGVVVKSLASEKTQLANGGGQSVGDRSSTKILQDKGKGIIFKGDSAKPNSALGIRDMQPLKSKNKFRKTQRPTRRMIFGSGGGEFDER